MKMSEPNKTPIDFGIRRLKPGDPVKYVGDGLGKFPKKINHIMAILLCIDEECNYAWIETSNPNSIAYSVAAVKLEDCLPENHPTVWPSIPDFVDTQPAVEPWSGPDNLSAIDDDTIIQNDRSSLGLT